MKAIWNNVVIAESDDTEIVEGNHYFPFDSIKQEYFKINKNQFLTLLHPLLTFHSSNEKTTTHHIKILTDKLILPK